MENNPMFAELSASRSVEESVSSFRDTRNIIEVQKTRANKCTRIDDGEERHPKPIAFYVSADDANLIAFVAKLTGCSTSTFVKSIVLKDLRKNFAKEAEIYANYLSTKK